MPRTSNLSSQFVESVIRRSTVLSAQHQAISLGQGFPDDEMPPRLKAAAIDAIANDRNQYSDTWGSAELRHAVAEKMNRWYGLSLTGPEHVTVTCGATEAMMAALLSVVDPGDEVILLEPVYENYRAQCLIARAKPVFVPLLAPGYEIDRERLSEAFNPRTAAIIVNNPNNPCGKVFAPEELRFMASLCEQHNVTAISDEVYEHLVYDGSAHTCLASIKELGDRWIVVSSCSKTYHATGWRIGYAVANPIVTQAIRRCHDFLSCAAPTPFQDASAVALCFGEEYYSSLIEHYDHKRRLLVRILNEVDLICRPPEGAYYVLADMSAYDFTDSVEFARFLIQDIGVAAVPWRSFYSDPELGRPWLRFTFSKSSETIQRAAERLQSLKTAPRSCV